MRRSVSAVADVSSVWRPARFVSSMLASLLIVSACGASTSLEPSEALTATAAPTATSTPAPLPTSEPTTPPAPSPTSEPTPTPAPSPTSEPTSTPAPSPTSEPAVLATPEEFDLTVFFRLAESLLTATNSAYAGTTPEVLTESAHASCRVLLAGGDVRSAIEAAIEASPLAGQPFGSQEQQFVLLVVTRGGALWCPDVITDQEAFTSEVISTLVDVFFDS